MFSSGLTQVLTVALAGLAAAAPAALRPRGQQVIVGYRKVSAVSRYFH
jgi:hypothetical protein